MTSADRLRAALASLHCTTCDQTKALDDFARNRTRPNGRSSQCLQCRRAYASSPGALKRRREIWLDRWERAVLHSARYRAKKRGIPFDLVEADIVIPDKCPILGIPLDRTHQAKAKDAPTLERINPKKGYVPGNILVVSWYANRLKSDCDDPQVFEAIARYLRESNANDPR